MTAPHATVLIVDDDAFVRSSAAEIVRQEGYEVREAGDGDAALSVLAEGGVDVVVLDMRMPGPGGRGVLDALDEHSPPVVLVTGFPLAGDAGVRQHDRVFTVLSKPFKPRALLDAVAGALGRGVGE
ncbi:MAG TPA: response regulator [Acidimicrobiales bacterium]|nr:response regulator [Acidimicrobiales bacterium]